MERRQSPRTQFLRHALVKHPKGFICPCCVDNISADGLYIKTTDKRLDKGSLVEMAIDCSPHMKPISVKGLVVHKKDHGIGLLCERGWFPSDFIPTP